MLTTKWEQQGNFIAKDIAAGGGAVWATGQDGGIYQLLNNVWVKKPGAAERITVDGNGFPWAINSNHNIFKWNPNKNDWDQYNGLGSDIGINNNGSVWLIGTDQIGNDGYGIYYMRAGEWVKTQGAAVRIAVGPHNHPWVINQGN